MNNIKGANKQCKKTTYKLEDFSDNLRRYRDGCGMTKKELLEKMNEYGISLSLRTYNSYENYNNKEKYEDYNKEKEPHEIGSQSLYVISDILGVSMNDLVGKPFDSKTVKNTTLSEIGLTPESLNTLRKQRNRAKSHSKAMIKGTAMIHPSSKYIKHEDIFKLDEISVINFLIQHSDLFSIFISQARETYCILLSCQEREKDLRNQLEKAVDNNEKKQINKKLKKIKDEKSRTINYNSFLIHDTVVKAFNKYIKYLSNIDKTYIKKD